MHKSADDDRVCGRCGALLLTASERRKLVRARAQAPTANPAAPENGARPGSAPTAVATGQRVAAKDESAQAIAIREALEHLDSAEERRSVPDRRVPVERRTADRRDTAAPSKGLKISRAWLIAMVVTVLVAIAIGLFLGLGGGSNASSGSGGGTPSSGPTATTVSLFQFTGSGPSTTGPFTTTTAFTFSYTVNCQEDLADPAVFQLMRAGHPLSQVASGVGGLTESGNEPSFGMSGTFTVAVSAPTSCTWTVSGET
ncbi:MAG: hypothetical protein ACLP6E_02180 [Acidimicrobiales bacterium]